MKKELIENILFCWKMWSTSFVDSIRKSMRWLRNPSVSYKVVFWPDTCLH